MNVSLTPKLEKLVHHKVKSGMYNSASEVIRESLRLLEERDKLRDTRLAELRKEVARGVRQLDAGQYVEHDGESLKKMFDDIKSAGRRRLAAGRENRP